MESPTEPHSTASAEKQGSVVFSQVDEPSSGYNGYVLDASLLRDGDQLKKAADGRTILIPQPSDSKDDPLNWTPRKKALTLAAIGVPS
jgi:hypothetical protein